ncbi:MAG: sugar phosphate isomerase/epimerase family protein [Thermoguttaceae bacterium]|jgi:sugar phosphate isomerase/epimerase
MFHSIPENHGLATRRNFFKAAGGLTAGAALVRISRALAGESPAAAPPRPAGGSSQEKQAPLVQIGILLGTFSRPTLEARLDAVKAVGLDCAQVSMDCAGVPAMPEQIPPELADRIRRAAAERGIAVTSVQGTFNMSHPDAQHRRDGLRRLGVLAAACQRLGTAKIHLCTGTRDRDNMWRRHPDNDSPEAWRDMVACMREAADIARHAGVVLAFEPEVNNVVDSAQKARRLLDEVRSPHLKVTMDAANLFHTGELARMSEILDRAFELLGKDIVLAHAKDLARDGDAGHEAAGHGRLDYDRYIALLHAHGFRGPLLLHGLSEAQVPGCVAFLREKVARLAAAPSKPADRRAP